MKTIKPIRIKTLRGLAAFIFLISQLLVVLICPAFVLSQSPAPTVSPTADEAVDENVEDIREAVKEKVQEKLAETQKRAFVGEITDISNSTLSLEARSGEKQVKTDEEAEIIGLNRREIKFEDLEIGSFVIAMGYLEDNGLLDGRRIVVTNKPKTPARLVAFGEVIDKSDDEEEKILTIKHLKKGTVYEVDATKTTKINKKVEGKMEMVKFEDIEIGDRLVAIGEPIGENNSLTAKIIQVIPGQAMGQQEEKTPTPTPEE